MRCECKSSGFLYPKEITAKLLFSLLFYLLIINEF